MKIVLKESERKESECNEEGIKKTNKKSRKEFHSTKKNRLGLGLNQGPSG